MARTAECAVYFGYCPHPVTVYTRGPLRAIYNHIIHIIQLLPRGGQYPKCTGFNEGSVSRSRLVRLGVV